MVSLVNEHKVPLPLEPNQSFGKWRKDFAWVLRGGLLVQCVTISVLCSKFMWFITLMCAEVPTANEPALKFHSWTVHSGLTFIFFVNIHTSARLCCAWGIRLPWPWIIWSLFASNNVYNIRSASNEQVQLVNSKMPCRTIQVHCTVVVEGAMPSSHVKTSSCTHLRLQQEQHFLTHTTF